MHAFVTDLRSGAAIGAATIDALGANGRVVASATTAADGTATIDLTTTPIAAAAGHRRRQRGARPARRLRRWLAARRLRRPDRVVRVHRPRRLPARRDGVGQGLGAPDHHQRRRPGRAARCRAGAVRRARRCGQRDRQRDRRGRPARRLPPDVHRARRGQRRDGLVVADARHEPRPGVRPVVPDRGLPHAGVRGRLGCRRRGSVRARHPVDGVRHGHLLRRRRAARRARRLAGVGLGGDLLAARLGRLRLRPVDAVVARRPRRSSPTSSARRARAQRATRPSTSPASPTAAAPITCRSTSARSVRTSTATRCRSPRSRR